MAVARAKPVCSQSKLPQLRPRLPHEACVPGPQVCALVCGCRADTCDALVPAPVLPRSLHTAFCTTENMHLRAWCSLPCAWEGTCVLRDLGGASRPPPSCARSCLLQDVKTRPSAAELVVEVKGMLAALRLGHLSLALPLDYTGEGWLSCYVSRQGAGSTALALRMHAWEELHPCAHMPHTCVQAARLPPFACPAHALAGVGLLLHCSSRQPPA